VGEPSRPYLTSGNDITYTLENLFDNQPNDVEYLIQTATIDGEFINIDNALSNALGFSGNEYPVDGTTTVRFIRETPPGDQVTWSWIITGPQFPLSPNTYLYHSEFFFNQVARVKIIARSGGDIPSCVKSVIFIRPQETEIPINFCPTICVFQENLGGFFTQYDIGVNDVTTCSNPAGESCNPQP
jgi:hypothetical protein